MALPESFKPNRCANNISVFPLIFQLLLFIVVVCILIAHFKLRDTDEKSGKTYINKTGRWLITIPCIFLGLYTIVSVVCAMIIAGHINQLFEKLGTDDRDSPTCNFLSVLLHTCVNPYRIDNLQ